MTSDSWQTLVDLLTVAGVIGGGLAIGAGWFFGSGRVAARIDALGTTLEEIRRELHGVNERILAHETRLVRLETLETRDAK